MTRGQVLRRVWQCFLALGLCSACTLSGGGDKVGHAIAGGVIAAHVERETGSRLQACMAALGAGVLKEAFDSARGGRGDPDDILATTVGCTAVWVF